MEDVPESGAVFTFGKSRFGDNNANKFWVKNDPVVAAACGDEHTAVITSTGRAYTFGSNQWGQLALGHTNQTNKPSFVKSLKGRAVTHVACGRTHTLLATKEEVYGCGGNGDHQVNETNADEVTLPFRISGLSGIAVKRISCGVEHSLLLSKDGEVYLWGSGSEGQLGMGDNVVELLKPTILQFTDERIKDAACGYYHTAIVTQSGKVFTFGEGESGKLGLGEDADDSYYTPQPVFLVEAADSVACGNTCTAVMTGSGSLYMCGEGQRGQLGFSPTTLNKCVYTLTKVPCPPAVTMSVGESHSGIVTKSGHLYTFGDGRHGKLCHGDDNFATLHSPYIVESFSTIATVGGVACGGCHTMVVAKPGRPFQHQLTMSTARTRRHSKPNRLSSVQGEDLLPANRDLTRDNNENIQIVQENVKNLESALSQDSNQNVKLCNETKKRSESPKLGVKVAGANNKADRNKKSVKKKAGGLDWKFCEEDSGSETDEPGATSDVTDSEEEEDEEEEDDSPDLLGNLMGIEELEPANNSSVIQVKSSPSPVTESMPVDKTTGKTPKDPIYATVEKVPKERQKGSESHIPLATTIEEEEEYETVTETDEEGSEFETDDEEDTEEARGRAQVKTLVNDTITTKEEPKSPAKPKAEMEPSPLQKTNPKKKPSKLLFWKKKPRETSPISDSTPRNQSSSQACTIL